ncbi:UNVERIFIED_CONTAM: hypothetical protein Scaly_2581600 [Sesamum calycinum]|uniref:Reverse transcriptase domain-containing protein n=2 Tax=Sesamum calycinum TaxID=2727403 RepID=A0AAW2JE37_9LAMI
MYEIVCKLKLLKAEFRRQKKRTGDLTANVRKAKDFLDKAQSLFTIHKEDIFLNLVKCCRRVYSAAVKLEISMLQQRAKLRWLKHGDQNSKVFFRKINSTRVKQRVFQITNINGETLTNQQEVIQEFVSYFQTLLGGNSPHRTVDLGFLQHEVRQITTAEASLLVAPATAHEVKEAFFEIDVESAPGPDGFGSAFYRAAWPVIGQSMVEAVGEFFRTGKLLKQINNTLLALIPKVNMPTYVSDYRPISCCNVLYKAITKIMVKRIQRVLPLLINYSQNAFVPGRSIADNILLAQELLAGYNQARLPERCTLKVDIQKAYDSVEWDFLLEGGRGLRQGDPISPYLFVLVMEIGSALLRYRIHNAPNFQYHWKCKDLGIINLCFADDVLLFCKADIPSIKILTDTLSEFATFSGLKVNPAKSQIILSRAVQQQRQQLLDCVGFQEGSLPIKYLGIPLSSSRLTIADCRPLIDKVDTRLAGWNHQTLSYAGRLQLIKSVISTLHTYWASVFILPKGVLKMLERKMRTFLWQGPSGEGQAKVAWDQICKPKAEGGLGLRSLIIMNQALILKQLWRILQNDGSSIWVDWIQQNRLRRSTIWTFNRSTGSWCWKKLLKLRPILHRGVHYKVGDGSSFSLWQDPWHDRGPLCLSFPRGIEVTGLPLSSTLSSVLQRNQWCWPAATDSDIVEIMSMLPPTTPSAVDTICWRSNSGKFTLTSAVLLIQPPSPHAHWQGLLQGKFKIPRHGFILWLAFLEKLSTMDKPWVPRTENGCVLCGGQISETHDHLFFKCWFSKRCLTILNHKVKFQWPYLEWQRGIMWASKRLRGNHLVNAALRATLAALVYHIWAERNSRKFAATSSSADLISNRVLEDIRMRIMATDIPHSLQSRSLYRIWKLTWPLGQ